MATIFCTTLVFGEFLHYLELSVEKMEVAEKIIRVEALRATTVYSFFLLIYDLSYQDDDFFKNLYTFV